MRTGVVLLVLLLVSGFSISLSSAAKDDPKCNGVFNGLTPVDVSKTADKAEAIPGETVTYTFAWEAIGTGSSVIMDCFQVDDGGDDALNAIVETANVELAVPLANAYDCVNNTRKCVDVPIAIPNNSDLIGHTVVDRGKLTRGNAESRTNALEIPIVAPPCTENCGGSTGTSTGDATGGTTDTGSSTGDATGGTTDTGSSTGDATGGTTDTGSSTGDATGGTTGGTSTTGGTTTGAVANEVLGNVFTRPLATTGSETTVLAVIGFAMLMVGAAMRFGRFGAREVYATSADSSPADMLAKALRARSREWTCRK